MATRPLVTFFKDIDRKDLASAGGKGANLGEMWQHHFPVPNGFAVTVESYDQFIKENNLAAQINSILKDTNVNDSSALASAEKRVQKLILTARIPTNVAKEAITAYKKLSREGGLFTKARVAVRSSATAEDLPNASFAGQQATYLDVSGENTLLTKIRECWASLFTARAIFYRTENRIAHEKVKISVIVQRMVHSVVSGVMFSVDPVTGDKDKIIIEAVWGLGEFIVQGSVVPDKYLVQKETFFILSKEVSDQSVQLVRAKGEPVEKPVPNNLRDKQKVSDENVIKLAKLANALQEHYYFPQDIEWAWDGKDIYIVQTRPITTLKNKKSTITSKDVQSAATPILSGSAASPGIGSGHAKVLSSPKEIGKINAGDVLVAKMTSPDYVPAMKKAAAIITDEGGQTSHAAIVSRELGVPCVVGTREATKKIKDGFVVTVDGTHGQVYLGSKVVKAEDKKAKEDEYKKYANVKTATKLFVNLAEPDRLNKIAKENVDGVGLLRAEFMIANIGIHPREALKLHKQEHFINKLAADLSKFCRAFGSRPVVYRATDFKTNEYRSLPGGQAWEPVEPNPLMGFRGAFRYVANPEVFNLELEAIKRVRAKHHNLALMIPYVRSPEELARVRRLVASAGLFESSTFRFWMMVELPVNVIMLEDFIKVGIDGISVGSNDLSMLVLGTDRDNAEVASAFNERARAVSWCLRRVARIAAKHGISCSICGQAPSVYEDLVERLVHWGFTSISVNPDAIHRVRMVIANAEKKFVNERIKKRREHNDS